MAIPIEVFPQCHELYGVYAHGKLGTGLTQKQMREVCPDLKINKGDFEKYFLDAETGEDLGWYHKFT